jgi:hypothetical protein
MAGGGAKKRQEENAVTLQKLAAYIVVCSTIFAVVRLWLKSASVFTAHYGGFAATLAVHGICYLSILAVSRATYKPDGSLEYVGDLNKGVIQYYFDLLYVTGFVQVVSAFTDWGWYLFLLVPAFGVYALVTKVIMPMRAASKKQEEQMDEATRKRLDRTAQRAERRRVKRI